MAAETLVHQVETDYYLAGDLTADQIKQVCETFCISAKFPVVLHSAD